MKIDTEEMYNSLPLQLVLAGPEMQISLDDDEDSAMPAELRTWLVRLRLLEGVPFANLVADTELLPEESIRWFYLDRRWTDALVQGALSVGTVNSDDRAQLTGAYPAIRDELDHEERNVRRRKGTPRFGGTVDAISGFILRSKAVSGWPGLHVRAFADDDLKNDSAVFKENDDFATKDPRRIRLLRLERLAPAVLLCLFDGIPQAVHIEEPRQGIQFGFDGAESLPGTPTLRPRVAATFKDIPGPPVKVPFRDGGSPGVVDIQELERRLRKIDDTRVDDGTGTNTGGGLDAGEYALQLVRFPYRQVWGHVSVNPFEVSDVFRAEVTYTKFLTALHLEG